MYKKTTQRWWQDNSIILNLIDGILEQPGRIMIVTTNKPEQLDAAFIRLGRIDMKIEFKKCTDKIIKEILYLYFKERTDITFKNYSGMSSQCG